MLAGAVVLLLPLFFFAQDSSNKPPSEYVIFPPEKITNPSSADPLLDTRRVEDAGRLWEVYADPSTKRELFRVDIGTSKVHWWSTGIWASSDFNRDGRMDYVWRGGDDTSEQLLVVLSSKSEHRLLDVFGTLDREWLRTYPKLPAADFAVDTAPLAEISLDWEKPDNLLLRALVRNGSGGLLELVVPSSRWKLLERLQLTSSQR
jgi:hypothetical protein